MRRAFLLVVLVGVLAGVGASVARADQPPFVQLAGQPFYFSGTCSGIGDVILFNQSLAPRPALVVVEGQASVVRPSYDTHAQTNGTCTITGGGFSIDTITPFDEPSTFDALIVP